MKYFAHRVAVITGAASGIGFALASQAAQSDMKVILADVQEEDLFEVETLLRGEGANAHGIVTDVAVADDVERLAEETLRRFGAVNLVCNNAGVGLTAPAWSYTSEDWLWVLGVNLFGVINGVRTFVPIMLDGGEEGHIVNTASVAGLTSQPGLAAYNVSKHGVVTLSETLYHDLALKDARIGVSVLCPGSTDTAILRAERNRLNENRSGAVHSKMHSEIRRLNRLMARGLRTGQSSDVVAIAVFDAVAKDKFWIRPEPTTEKNWNELIEIRVREILSLENPSDPLHRS